MDISYEPTGIKKPLEVWLQGRKHPKPSNIIYTRLAIGLSSNILDVYKLLYINDLTSCFAGDKVRLKRGINRI
jgi:hypothetical protein